MLGKCKTFNSTFRSFQNNAMLANPSNFQVVIIDKKKNFYTDEILKIKDKIVKYSSVKLFAIERDDQVNFNLRIFNIYRSAANQLNSWITLERVFIFEENKLLINSYFCLNCNFCPLVRMFSSAKH